MSVRRRLSLIAAAFVPLAALALAAGPAQAASINYVALGDSYSSGAGATGGSGLCVQSPNGYPTLWAKAHGITSFVNATCAGATMDTVTQTQLSKLSADTNVITMSIGGNDVGFVGIVLQCLVLGDAGCQKAVDSALAKKAEYVAKADQLATKIQAKSPNAKAFLLGYPYLFETTRTCPGGPSLNQKQRQILRGGVDILDDTLRDVAVAHGWSFVDVRASFAGHSSCAAQPWINGLSAGPVPLHPNDAGYAQGYLPALTAVTG